MSMTPSAVVKAVQSCGIECAHMCFPKNSAPALPWAVYYVDETNGLCADNGTYDQVPTWIVELYERSMDFELESAVAQAIESAFAPPVIEQEWVEDEDCLMTTYTFREI